MKKLSIWAILFLFPAIFGGYIFGQTANIKLKPFLSGLSSPLFLTNAKDGSRRIFVVQQRGLIKVFQNGSTNAANFIDLSTKVSQSGGERGLLGLAFHPQFATNGFFFVNYTRDSDGATVIARYKAVNNNSAGDLNSEVILLTIAQPFSNHNGGMIEFRNDNGGNNLYIGMGDGGSGNDPNGNAQNINSLLGKFLRITPDLSATPPTPAYTIPADNPYVGVNGADEIYAVGMRNPWRWSFDRATKQLWAGDVGQDAIEEFDTITRGGNYGWRVFEGTQCTNNDPALCNPNNYTPPVSQYEQTSQRCAITGGYVYRGNFGTFAGGSYIYGDYCSGEVWKWNGTQSSLLLSTSRLISSFGEDEDGEIYVVGLGGTVEKIVSSKSSADFDGDGKTDFGVFRPSNSVWYILNSLNYSVSVQQFGISGDIPAPEDFDGDGKTDIALYRPSNGTWYYLRSSDNSFGAVQFGLSGDIPAAGNYVGDARADFVVYRPSEKVWYFLSSDNFAFSAVQFGLSEDIPAPGDFDGDGKDDISLYRPSNGVWYRLNSTNNNFIGVQFGLNGDIAVSGDYDGDGKTDQSVYRPSTNVWYILQSSNNNFQALQWGINGDIPVVGDYDGDSREDVAVFRPSNGSWYILKSSNSSLLGVQWGTNGDLPAPSYDAP